MQRMEGAGNHTVTENAMELVFGKEREPVDALLLVLAQFRLDRDRDAILLDFAAVKELHEELTLLLPTLEKILGEVGRIWQTRFKWNHLHQRRERVGGSSTHIVIWITHTPEHRHDHEDDIGQSLDVQLLNNI